MLDALSIRRVIDISKPDKVFHFAAQSFPEVSFKIPVITIQTNMVGTTHLLEIIKESFKSIPNLSNFRPVEILSIVAPSIFGLRRKPILGFWLIEFATESTCLSSSKDSTLICLILFFIAIGLEFFLVYRIARYVMNMSVNMATMSFIIYSALNGFTM